MKRQIALADETLLFVALTLLLAFLFQLPNILNAYSNRLWNSLTMITLGVVGLMLSWLLRREPPRATGFSFSGWKPYFAAFLFPPAVQMLAIALAYAYRSLASDPDFIAYTPTNPAGSDYQPFHGSCSYLGIILALGIAVAPWFLIAASYAQGWPARMRAALPSPLGALILGILWLPVFWINDSVLMGVHFQLPGELGEELGWRGYLVRRWLPRPLMAAALSMPVWAAFHLPVILLPAQRGRWSQNLAFLAAIAMFGAVMLKLYQWSRSIWPCAFLHLWWNLSNETLLGDVYGWHPGLLSGKFWIFNGEGLFGLIVMAPIAACVIWGFRHEEEP